MIDIALDVTKYRENREMKILHCCLSCFYIDGFGYQENILPKINHLDGHDVLIIASTETFINGKIGYLEPSKYVTKYGVPIIRLPYKKYIPHFIGKKLRIFPDFNHELNKFKPDVILFHGTCGYEIQTVASYKSINSNVVFYVDCHEAFYNSAKNWLSKNVLHKMLYKRWLRKSLNQIDKVFYIGLGEKKYLQDMMNINEELMEYYPLGGELIRLTEKNIYTEEIRNKYDLRNEIIFFHSGKINRKKKTIELINSFRKIDSNNCKLIISGTIEPDLEKEFYELVSCDSRVIFVQWLNSKDLRKHLAAADLYLQPGSPSATLQNALCVGTPVMAYKADYYELLINDGAGFSIENDNDIEVLIQKVVDGKIDLNQASMQAFTKANDILDYNKLAARLYVSKQE